MTTIPKELAAAADADGRPAAQAPAAGSRRRILARCPSADRRRDGASEWWDVGVTINRSDSASWLTIGREHSRKRCADSRSPARPRRSRQPPRRPAPAVQTPVQAQAQAELPQLEIRPRPRRADERREDAERFSLQEITAAAAERRVHHQRDDPVMGLGHDTAVPEALCRTGHADDGHDAPLQRRWALLRRSSAHWARTDQLRQLRWACAAEICHGWGFAAAVCSCAAGWKSLCTSAARLLPAMVSEAAVER